MADQDQRIRRFSRRRCGIAHGLAGQRDFGGAIAQKRAQFIGACGPFRCGIPHLYSQRAVIAWHFRGLIRRRVNRQNIDLIRVHHLQLAHTYRQIAVSRECGCIRQLPVNWVRHHGPRSHQSGWQNCFRKRFHIHFLLCLPSVLFQSKRTPPPHKTKFFTSRPFAQQNSRSSPNLGAARAADLDATR